MWIRAALENIETAASETGITLQDLRSNPRGRGYLLRLKLGPKREDGTRKYQRLNHKLTRKVAAVCWHGHRDFMIRLFELEPSARINTAFAKYHGIEGFEANYPATAGKQIGSAFEPCRYVDACECSEQDVSARVVMKQSEVTYRWQGFHK